MRSNAQSATNDVHIPVQPRGIELATALPEPRVPVIRAKADLVTVPVSITDSLNRPIIGLDENNFQLFENKKAQQIKKFSSEDAPFSVGILLDASGSMANKLDRAREAVRQFCEASNPADEFFLIAFL
ncbi:MAG TPA: hypothetical protein VMG82_37235 [Candidatus Sulfotelmatobacter sp.]|nr:hypothetical protein [Candidatus Sulfotelmatobacter sp.]